MKAQTKQVLIRMMTGLLAVSSTPALAKLSSKAQAPAQSLEEQLQALDVGNTMPAGSSHDSLYAVQSRYLPLRRKSEFSMGGASNLTANGFLSSYQMELAYRFHFNDRWGLGLAGGWVHNQFTAAARNIESTSGALPEVPFTYSRSDLTVEYNFLYGKFRWSAETVSYFDIYGALGPGLVVQSTGKSGAAVGDIGVVAWLGQRGSLRLGLKDYYYKETYSTGPVMAHNLHGHANIGYLF